jgi:hypothetical protein
MKIISFSENISSFAWGKNAFSWFIWRDKAFFSIRDTFFSCGARTCPLCFFIIKEIFEKADNIKDGICRLEEGKELSFTVSFMEGTFEAYQYG